MSLELTNYDHEEAETLLILHALDVTKYNAFKECIVLSPDTDLFSTFNIFLQIASQFNIFLVQKKLGAILTSKVVMKQLE